MPSAPMSMSMSMSIRGSSSSMPAGHRRPPSPFADLHHRRRRTRTSSVPTHPHSNSFLFPISSSQLQFTFASLYSSSSSSCYDSESRSRSKSEATLCNTCCCCCFNPTNAHHQLSNSYSSSISISNITASSDTSPSHSQGFGNVRRGVRFLVVACACVLFVTRCQRVIALEQGVSGTCGQFFIIKGRVFGPKLMQVLVVLKEQGLILAALLSLSAFFSMAETSITTLWPWKVRELAEKEPENGVFRMLHSDVTRFLTTILIGTTVVNIAATALVTEAATTIFGEAGVTAATGVMTVAVLLLTEITPKSIAVHNATDVARFVARPVAWLSLFLYPVGRVVTFLSMGMLKMLGLEGRSEPYVTEDELKLMLRGAELSGAIEEEEQDMIENVLEIKDTHVREVMTPLVDVVAIDGSATLIDFQKSWETHQYSRVPVFEERIDNIMGIAYAMDLLEYVGRAEKLKESTVRDIAHPTYFVPDSMSVWNLLREFRIRKVHMAVVLNEYGGTVGIVTLEDVVEEIVGEIFDENDSKEEIQKKTGYIVMQEDGTFDVDANTSIDQLSEELGVKIPEGHQYETVSGFICESFGYIPEEGAQMIVLLERATQVDNNEYTGIESDNRDEKEKHQTFELEVLEANERKVGKVRFKPINHVSSDLETKGLNRLLSTKVVKMKMNRETEPAQGHHHHHHAGVHLQLRVRALLFDKASASLFLPHNSSSSPSSSSDQLSPHYLQFHGDDIFYSLQEDDTAIPLQGSSRPAGSKGNALPHERASSVGSGYNELPETWYSQYFDKLKARYLKFPHVEKESLKRTSEGMSAYLRLSEIHKRKRRAFEKDLHRGIGDSVSENGSLIPQKIVPRVNGSTEEDVTFFPEFMFPSNCVPDISLPLRNEMEKNQKVDVYGILDNLPTVVSRSTAMMERFGIRPDYIRVGRKYRALDGSGCEKKPLCQEQASLMTHKIVTRFLVNAGFDSATGISMEVFSEFFCSHICRLGRILKLLTDSYKKQFTSVELLQMFLQTAGYTNIGALIESTKDGNKSTITQTPQHVRAVQSQHQNSLLQSQTSQQFQRQMHTQPQMHMIHPQSLSVQQQQQLEKLRRRQATTPRNSVSMMDKDQQPMVDVKIENSIESSGIDTGTFNALNKQHPLQYRQQLQQQQQQIALVNQHAGQSGQQQYRQLQPGQIPQLQVQNVYGMRAAPPVKVEAFHELMGGDSTLKHESDHNKLTSPSK